MAKTIFDYITENEKSVNNDIWLFFKFPGDGFRIWEREVLHEKLFEINRGKSKRNSSRMQGNKKISSYTGFRDIQVSRKTGLTVYMILHHI